MRFFLTLLATVLACTLASARTFEEDRDAANACFRARDAAPELQRLAQRLAYADPTSSQLADSGVASAEEQSAIQRRQNAGAQCREMMLAATRANHPWLTSAFEIRYLQIDLVLMKLLERRITFGAANRLMHDSFLELSGRLERYAQLVAEQDRREQAERDRQTAEEARRWRDSMKSTYAPPKVVVCSWRGSLLICI